MNLWYSNPVNSVEPLTFKSRAIPSQARKLEGVETIRKEYAGSPAEAQGTVKFIIDKIGSYDIVPSHKKLWAGDLCEYVLNVKKAKMNLNSIKDNLDVRNVVKLILKSIIKIMKKESRKVRNSIEMIIMEKSDQMLKNGEKRIEKKSDSKIENHTKGINHGMMKEEEKCFLKIHKLTGHDLCLTSMSMKVKLQDRIFVKNAVRNVNLMDIIMTITSPLKFCGFVSNVIA